MSIRPEGNDGFGGERAAVRFVGQIAGKIGSFPASLDDVGGGCGELRFGARREEYGSTFLCEQVSDGAADAAARACN